MVRLPADFFLALRRALAHDRSEPEAATLARRVGSETTGPVWDALTSAAAQDREPGAISALPADQFWRTFADFFGTLGWGALHYSELHPGIGALDSEDWAEADASDPSDQPACHFSTGLLADLLRRVAGYDVAVLEAECRSRGDERCRFLIGSPATLEAVYREVRGGTPYTEAIDSLG